MKLSSLGEFALIERLASAPMRYTQDDLVVGIGDDAAVWRLGDEFLVATTDTMVEGVHFLPGADRWGDIGWKAMAVNQSDFAAMGAWPRLALVTLCLPLDTEVQAIDGLFEGLNICARSSATMVAGGDVVRAPQVSITVALLGRAEQRDGEPLLLRRNAAQVGDVAAVTGTLGDSAAGLRRLREGAGADDPLVRAHVRPGARLAEGKMAVLAGITCGIDVSDGLVQDLGHVCKASGVGAVLRAVTLPLSDDLLAAYPEDAVTLACTGGEDYELLLIGPRERLDEINAESGEERLTFIGEIVGDPDRSVKVFDEAGKPIHFERAGWDAFRS